MLEIQWLLEPEAPAEGLEEGRRPLPMPASVGEGWLETLEMPLGMVLHDLHYRFVPALSGEWIDTATLQAQLDEPRLVIMAIPQGRGRMVDGQDGRVHAYGAGEVLLGFSAAVDAAYQAEAGPALQGVTIELEASRLQRVMGEAEAADFLAALDLSGGTMQALRAPLIERRLQACVAPKLHGAMRKLLVQSEVLSLLCDLAGLGQAAESGESPLTKVLRLIREEVDQSPQSPPNPDDLARRYGFSARTLNEGFRQQFGSTLLTYCAEQRLNAAYQVIVKTDLALKVLAARLGYAHVSNFTAAFRRQFGVTPGSLRRTQPERSPGNE